MTTTAHPVRPKMRRARQERRQVNLVFMERSSSLRLLEEAERLTGQSLTKIIRALIDSRLGDWVEEEVDQRRRLDEAARREQPTDLPVRQLGRLRPRYGGESGLQSGYAEAAALRVSPRPRVVARHENVPIE